MMTRIVRRKMMHRQILKNILQASLLFPCLVFLAYFWYNRYILEFSFLLIILSGGVLLLFPSRTRKYIPGLTSKNLKIRLILILFYLTIIFALISKICLENYK